MRAATEELDMVGIAVPLIALAAAQISGAETDGGVAPEDASTEAVVQGGGGGCVDGSYKSCTLSNCALARQYCDTPIWLPCRCIIQSCDDGNPCTTDYVSGSTCAHGSVAAGVSCGDGNACNGAETCNGAGQCVAGTAPVVNDGNSCTTDSCDPSTGAVSHVPVPVDDGNPCTADACNPATGGISHTAVPVDDGNACTADACNSATGAISHSAIAVGTSCTVPNAGGEWQCNGAGTCVAASRIDFFCYDRFGNLKRRFVCPMGQACACQ